jgi:hypothetical protein
VCSINWFFYRWICGKGYFGKLDPDTKKAEEGGLRKKSLSRCAEPYIALNKRTYVNLHTLLFSSDLLNFFFLSILDRWNISPGALANLRQEAKLSNFDIDFT